ncbi:hypothetical protein B9Z19DRAFT_1134983 [Tuber borchii]|uniref:Uncharacterized protein n=1 Tax=Tuber borchii TaxID=42251 RepID=A0A2T6ZDJ9_TUBBO|nr:hypothetical protein B9Z19DRAFT_1134983 [Tuber borchii]
MSDYRISVLNEKWTERLQEHNAVWSKRLEELDAMWSKRLKEADALHLKSSVELDAMWSKRFQEAVSLRVKSFAELDAIWSKRFQEADSLRLKSSTELETMRFDRSQKQWRENERLVRENQELNDRIASEGKKNIQLKQILNIRGALRNIVDQAKLVESISPTAGTQEGLDELSKREEFTTILEKQVEARGLTVERVMASFHGLDSVVSKLLRFNPDFAVTIPYADFRDEERAALAILFELQAEWPKSIWFNEEEAPEIKDKYPDYEYYSE